MVTLPVLRDLKLNYPEIEIHTIVSNKNYFIFNDTKYIDKIICYGKNDKFRKVFEIDDCTELNSEISNFERSLLKIFIIGHIIHFFIYCMFPWLTDKNFRERIKNLKDEHYDAVFDLKGNRRIAIVSRLISDFTVGSRLFGFSWLYSYYLNSNWVSQSDSDFMTKKIERSITSATGLKFAKRDISLPLIQTNISAKQEKIYDILFHIGTAELRKLERVKEKLILDSFSDKNVLITDSHNSNRFARYREIYPFEFKLYNSLEDIIPDAMKAKLVICYDGGQAHYLSQFVKTITIFGPGSVMLWKPYEFKNYEPENFGTNGTVYLKSSGRFGHIAVHHPVICSPCFDIGCKVKPCLDELNIKELISLISNNLN